MIELVICNYDRNKPFTLEVRNFDGIETDYSYICDVPQEKAKILADHCLVRVKGNDPRTITQAQKIADKLNVPLDVAEKIVRVMQEDG